MKSAALFLSGIFLFLLLVYCGLHAAEKGVLELAALPGPTGALQCELKKGEVEIIFAGNKYYLSLEWINLFYALNLIF